MTMNHPAIHYLLNTLVWPRCIHTTQPKFLRDTRDPQVFVILVPFTARVQTHRASLRWRIRSVETSLMRYHDTPKWFPFTSSTRASSETENDRAVGQRKGPIPARTGCDFTTQVCACGIRMHGTQHVVGPTQTRRSGRVQGNRPSKDAKCNPGSSGGVGGRIPPVDYRRAGTEPEPVSLKTNAKGFGTCRVIYYPAGRY